MPACNDPLVNWILDAFMTLSSSRQQGFSSAGRIQISEIAAFVQLVECPIPHHWLLKAVQEIDSEYMKWQKS